MPGTPPVDGGLPDVTLPCLGGGPDVDLVDPAGPADRQPLGVLVRAVPSRRCRRSQDFYEKYGDQVPVIGIDYQDLQPKAALELAKKSGRHLPAARRPQGDLRGARRRSRPRRRCPSFAFVDADGTVTLERSAGRTRRRPGRPGRRAPRDQPVTASRADLPDWLRPVEQAAREIEASDLTRFVPPPGGDARRGAVLMLFGEGPQGGELLLTERAHDMRSHPGPGLLPRRVAGRGGGRGRGRPA